MLHAESSLSAGHSARCRADRSCLCSGLPGPTHVVHIIALPCVRQEATFASIQPEGYRQVKVVSGEGWQAAFATFSADLREGLGSQRHGENIFFWARYRSTSIKESFAQARGLG
jgi:hypothetical protein